MLDNKINVNLPEDGKVYDFYFDRDAKIFKSWRDLYENFEIETKVLFFNILLLVIYNSYQQNHT